MFKPLLGSLIVGFCLNSQAMDFSITQQFVRKRSESSSWSISASELAQFSKRNRIYSDTVSLLKKNITQSTVLKTLDSFWGQSGDQVVIQIMPEITFNIDKIAFSGDEKETILSEKFNSFYVLLNRCPISARGLSDICDIKASVLVFRDRDETRGIKYEHGQILSLNYHDYAPGHQASLYFDYFKPSEVATKTTSTLIQSLVGTAQICPPIDGVRTSDDCNILIPYPNFQKQNITIEVPAHKFEKNVILAQ